MKTTKAERAQNMIKSEITLVEDAIHNDNDPRHYMTVTNISSSVSAKTDGVEIAWSRNVLKLKEVARSIYDPTYYFPIEDIRMDMLSVSEKTTHCPLKGDTQYYSLRVGTLRKNDIAWRYHKPLEKIQFLENFVSFDSRVVQIIEYTPHN
jgi:uncharacterized protein (DUF427 family)